MIHLIKLIVFSALLCNCFVCTQRYRPLKCMFVRYQWLPPPWSHTNFAISCRLKVSYVLLVFDFNIFKVSLFSVVRKGYAENTRFIGAWLSNHRTHQFGHPEKYSGLSLKRILVVFKYPQKKYLTFEKVTGLWCPRVTKINISDCLVCTRRTGNDSSHCPCSCDYSSGPFLAEISVMSPRKIIIFII